MRLVAFYTLIILLLFSCKKAPEPEVKQVEVGNHYAMVLNEGNFMWNNASITIYSDGNESQEVYKSVNGESLGDVLQSALHDDNLWYLVLNNSGKINVIGDDSFEKKNQFQINGSPRYLQIFQDSLLFVSDYYDSVLHQVNMVTKTITKLNISKPAEEILIQGNYMYLTNNTGNYFYQLDVGSRQIIDSVELAGASRSINYDLNGFLWVYCRGNVSGGVKPTIYKINPQDLNIMGSWTLPSNIQGFNSYMRINVDRNILYVMGNDGLYKIDANNPMNPTIPFIENYGYGFGIDDNDYIYICDAKDLISNGVINVYNSLGDLVTNFDSGRIPNEVVFK